MNLPAKMISDVADAFRRYAPPLASEFEHRVATQSSQEWFAWLEELEAQHRLPQNVKQLLRDPFSPCGDATGRGGDGTRLIRPSTLFGFGETEDLAALLLRAERDGRFLTELAPRSRSLRRGLSQARERSLLLRVMREALLRSGWGCRRAGSLASRRRVTRFANGRVIRWSMAASMAVGPVMAAGKR